MTRAKTNPFDEGYRAALRSDTKRCPYDANTLKAMRWWSGFGAAQRDLEQRRAAVEVESGQLSLFGQTGAG